MLCLLPSLAYLADKIREHVAIGHRDQTKPNPNPEPKPEPEPEPEPEPRAKTTTTTTTTISCGGDAELATILRRMGVVVTDEQGDDVVVRVPDMDVKNRAAYAALHWYRVNKDVPFSPAAVQLVDMLPSHPEFRQKQGRPYVNTLALLRVPAFAAAIVRRLAQMTAAKGANVVVAFETRAMAFGALVAYEIGASFVPVRKAGTMPGLRLAHASVNEEEMMVMDGYCFIPTDNVMIVDDVVCTGSTVEALKRLVELQGARVVGCAALVDLTGGYTYTRIPGHESMFEIKCEDSATAAPSSGQLEEYETHQVPSDGSYSADGSASSFSTFASAQRTDVESLHEAETETEAEMEAETEAELGHADHTGLPTDHEADTEFKTTGGGGSEVDSS
jgi:adenine phosphoribosyltransferase